MKDEADRNLGRRGPVIDRRSREKANSKLRRWNNLRGLRSGNSRRGLVGVETKIADVPAMASDRQREISRTRADIENDVTLAERHMANETVAPHALARRHRDAEIIKGRQDVLYCRWPVGSSYGFRVGPGRLLSTLLLRAGLRPPAPVSRRTVGARS